MARLFGVSRSTIREALRILVTDGLVETRRGVHGGTFVVEVNTAHLEGLLSTTLDQLAVTKRVGVGDFLQAWVAIEAPATALAARNATAHDIAALIRLSEPIEESATRSDMMSQGVDFHSSVLHASGNVLLEAMGRPVSAVARARLLATDPTGRFFRSVNKEHRHIAEAVADGDAATARTLAVEHIEALHAYYSSPKPVRDGEAM